MSKTDGGEKYLKICLLTMYMSGVFTKHPPEKLEYWRQYRRDNAAKCKEQRRQWREANRDRIRLCARRSYYRRALREGQGDATSIQTVISSLDNQIAAMLATESQ
tara:strand:- start:796 stop:1110 length:315 start_codon:yes stop_codon:yes gene_type:complete